MSFQDWRSSIIIFVTMSHGHLTDIDREKKVRERINKHNYGERKLILVTFKDARQTSRQIEKVKGRKKERRREIIRNGYKNMYMIKREGEGERTRERQRDNR